VTGWRDHQPVELDASPVGSACRVSFPAPCAERLGGLRDSAAQQKVTGLADEGQVVVAAGGIRDGGATIGRDPQVGQVCDVSAVDAN
jgi:hypothetical protein